MNNLRPAAICAMNFSLDPSAILNCGGILHYSNWVWHSFILTALEFKVTLRATPIGLWKLKSTTRATHAKC